MPFRSILDKIRVIKTLAENCGSFEEARTLYPVIEKYLRLLESDWNANVGLCLWLIDSCIKPCILAEDSASDPRTVSQEYTVQVLADEVRFVTGTEDENPALCLPASMQSADASDRKGLALALLYALPVYLQEYAEYYRKDLRIPDSSIISAAGTYARDENGTDLCRILYGENLPAEEETDAPAPAAEGDSDGAAASAESPLLIAASLLMLLGTAFTSGLQQIGTGIDSGYSGGSNYSSSYRNVSYSGESQLVLYRRFIAASREFAQAITRLNSTLYYVTEYIALTKYSASVAVSEIVETINPILINTYSLYESNLRFLEWNVTVYNKMASHVDLPRETMPDTGNPLFPVYRISSLPDASAYQPDEAVAATLEEALNELESAYNQAIEAEENYRAEFNKTRDSVAPNIAVAMAAWFALLFAWFFDNDYPDGGSFSAAMKKVFEMIRKWIEKIKKILNFRRS